MSISLEELPPTPQIMTQKHRFIKGDSRQKKKKRKRKFRKKEFFSFAGNCPCSKNEYGTLLSGMHANNVLNVR